VSFLYCMHSQLSLLPPPCDTFFLAALHICLLQAIGEDLFAIALDQPFRFPATFTFVLRAFSTLEVRIGRTSPGTCLSSLQCSWYSNGMHWPTQLWHSFRIGTCLKQVECGPGAGLGPVWFGLGLISLTGGCEWHLRLRFSVFSTCPSCSVWARGVLVTEF
jgi:hypothetical protein